MCIYIYYQLGLLVLVLEHIDTVEHFGHLCVVLRDDLCCLIILLPLLISVIMFSTLSFCGCKYKRKSIFLFLNKVIPCKITSIRGITPTLHGSYTSNLQATTVGAMAFNLPQTINRVNKKVINELNFARR